MIWQVMVCNWYATHVMRCNLKLRWPLSILQSPSLNSSTVQVWIAGTALQCVKPAGSLAAAAAAAATQRLSEWASVRWPVRVTCQLWKSVTALTGMCCVVLGGTLSPARRGRCYRHRQASNYLLLFKFVACWELSSSLGARLHGPRRHLSRIQMLYRQAEIRVVWTGRNPIVLLQTKCEKWNSCVWSSKREWFCSYDVRRWSAILWVSI